MVQVTVEAGEVFGPVERPAGAAAGPRPLGVSVGGAEIVFDDDRDAVRFARAILWRLGETFDGATDPRVI